MEREGERGRDGWRKRERERKRWMEGERGREMEREEEMERGIDRGRGRERGRGDRGRVFLWARLLVRSLTLAHTQTNYTKYNVWVRSESQLLYFRETTCLRWQVR